MNYILLYLYLNKRKSRNNTSPVGLSQGINDMTRKLLLRTLFSQFLPSFVLE